MAREEYRLMAFENMLETMPGPSVKDMARGYWKLSNEELWNLYPSLNSLSIV
jgi:hypothetical protein